VAGFQIADIGVRDKLPELVGRTPRDRLEQKADVVAEVDAAEYRSGEPPNRVVENRQAVRARMPCAMVEFVDPIDGLAAEQAGEFAVLPLDQVHRKMAGAVGYPVGVIEFRQPRQEPRRADAHLTGEPDKAACRLVTGVGGYHEHRIVEQGDQLLESFRHGSIARVVAWPESMQPPTWSV
jgi:hypothetical protein